MSDGTNRCRITEVTLPRGVRAVRLESDLVRTTVLIDKGADLYDLVHKPTGVDVLWKSPWGLKRPGSVQVAANSHAGWIEQYPGGWQVIFPSGGGPCDYKGVELNFHGEAALTGWEYEVVAEGEAAELALWTRLYRSPFLIERTLRLETGSPSVLVRERITNQGGEAIDYMWSHHPAFGPPLLDGACRIDTNARSLWADPETDHPANPLIPDEAYAWPHAERDGTTVDLSVIPDEATPRLLMAYLGDFADEAAWYALTNPGLGLGVGLVWDRAAFPHAWFWQEMHALEGFPWYKGVYVMAIEPATSIPGQGLLAAMEKTGTHRTLQPGESAAAELRAVFSESGSRISRIDPDGAVHTP